MSKAKDRQKLSWEGMFYSIQRIDLLIVSICGAGIYVCLETIKYLSDKSQDISLLVRISGGLFLFGIIINFISQLFGYKANKEDFLMCQAEIDAGDKINEKEKAEIKEFDRKAEKFSNLTDKFNYVSMGLMFVGLILIMYYFLFTF
ncbi:hypothetical protein V8G69_12155 [Gaetbulibacter sp. M235]|uniref:hypothetical protein n=1 Tax=Gaetbulibacter sp. M235 TaxID=3126510 RepID=UPI00374E72CA